ncbi:hypothetical protein I4U23_030986 [Adineta vaga]|nr:hypothetical protein I4U23_030986 [Adineta vaga]
MERQSTIFILMKIIRDLNYNTNTEAREQQRRFLNEPFISSCIFIIIQLFDKPCRNILGNKNVTSSSTTNSSLTSNKNDHNYLSRIRENRLLRKQIDQEFQSEKLSLELHSLATSTRSLSILSRLNETLKYVRKQLHEQFHRINVGKNIEYVLNILKFIQEHQASVQIQQQEYLQIQTTENQRYTSTINSSSLSNSNNYHSVIDFLQYFTKKVPPRSQQIPRLFEFSHSAQFNSMTSYLQDQNRFAVKPETSTAISSKYISFAYIFIIKLTEFIRDRFIGRVIKDICESAQLSSSSTIADQNRLAELVPVVLQKQLQLSMSILQSTYLIFKSCEELCALVKCLPPYEDDNFSHDLIFGWSEKKLFDVLIVSYALGYFQEITLCYSAMSIRENCVQYH